MCNISSCELAKSVRRLWWLKWYWLCSEHIIIILAHKLHMLCINCFTWFEEVTVVLWFGVFFCWILFFVILKMQEPKRKCRSNNNDSQVSWSVQTWSFFSCTVDVFCEHNVQIQQKYDPRSFFFSFWYIMHHTKHNHGKHSFQWKFWIKSLFPDFIIFLCHQ